jgi:hypothetical protein
MDPEGVTRSPGPNAVQGSSEDFLGGPEIGYPSDAGILPQNKDPLAEQVGGATKRRSRVLDVSSPCCRLTIPSVGDPRAQ